MKYVNVQDSTIVARRRGRPEKVWIQDTPVAGHYEKIASDAEAISFGWFPLVIEPRPDDTATTTFDQVVVYEPTQVRQSWVERNKTQEELDAESVQLATKTERDQAKAAVTNLRAYIEDNNPTNASTVAVVKLLCRVAIRLIKDQYGG